MSNGYKVILYLIAEYEHHFQEVEAGVLHIE